MELFVIVFVDSILNYSRNEEEYATYLRVDLQIPKDPQLFSMFSKCELCLQFFGLLSHIVSSDGIRVDSQKIKEVKQYPRPISTTYIRIFLGLGGYYKSFLVGFLYIHSSLTRLTQKIVMFQ